MHLQDLGAQPLLVPEPPGHPADLPDSRQEAEHVTVPLPQGAPHHGRDVLREHRIDPHAVRRPHGPLRRRPYHVHGMGRAVRGDDGRAGAPHAANPVDRARRRTLRAARRAPARPGASPCGRRDGESVIGRPRNATGRRVARRRGRAGTGPAEQGADQPSASVVAEAATSHNSGRGVARTSSRNAAAVSASRCRSWHSSSITTATPASS